MSLTHLLVPTYVQMFNCLSAWLAKAQGSGADADALLTARLAPDMYPLSTQIRFACVQAQEAVYRLKGEDFPASLGALIDEGRNGAEHPGSIEDAQARIAQTVALLEALGPDALDAASGTMIAHTLPNGIILDLTADQYARDWSLSQFYFHLMTAYAILRANGVELGKADYIPHIFPYVRPGTMPTA
ncbi:hypothetical protein EBBID32_23680 [Sphingobium indicum BiD32]|uniref:DUF1993 domain-containing protein n=1 Tax=Sphingobium indicum BiD32 TaxID=1301087 RepID=N1MRF0_9SPHN|nr:DUF1993 domain-containing protein [Sphingobium indicum]CCW18018.1 hypothetical protein EBBID32_23680 [Sphingobium indicum BiD32]